MIDQDDIEVIKPTLRRNFSSNFNLNIKNSLNFEDNNDYKYMCESDERKMEKNRKIIQMSNNLFNNCKTTRNDDYLLHKDKEQEVNFSQKKINTIKRPITSKNLKSNMHGKFGFSKVNINENEKNIFEEFKAPNLIVIFPKKHSSKVGNYIYDRINTMIKSKKKLKLKLGKKKGAKPGIRGEDYYNKDKKVEEESKYNKNISNHNHKDSKNNTDKKLNNFFFEDDYKYENLKNKVKIFDSKIIKNHFCKNPFAFGNKIGSNFYYSCCNNYIINNKRKKKNKYLNDYSDSPSLDEILAEILLGDKLKNAIERIKAINHK